MGWTGNRSKSFLYSDLTLLFFMSYISQANRSREEGCSFLPGKQTYAEQGLHSARAEAGPGNPTHAEGKDSWD